MYVHHLISHPEFVETDASEEVISLTCNDIDEHQEKRAYIKYVGSADAYLTGVYIGHALPFETPVGPEVEPTKKPLYYCRATTWGSDVNILRE